MVSLSIATGLAGCMGRLGPPVTSPASLGEHPVGVTTVSFTDPSRNRHLTVEVWYPAAHTSSDPPVVYDVESMGMTVARLRSAGNAHRDAEPLHDGLLPVVLVSHGRGSTRFANVSLSEVLASHGYVVAAPDHPGNTMSDQVTGISDHDRAESALDRPLDLSRVLDDLVERSKLPKSPFYGIIDADRAGIVGHSFGGLAALEMTGARFDAARQEKDCQRNDDDWRCAAATVFGDKPYRYRDNRIKAAMLISPAGFDLFRADGIAQVNAPTLVIGAKADQNTPFEKFSKPTFEALTSPRYFLPLDKAGHLTATDVCEVVDSVGFFAKTLGGKDARDGCSYSARDALDAVSKASVPFFDLYLSADESARDRLMAALPQSDETPKIARTESRPAAQVAASVLGSGRSDSTNGSSERATPTVR